MPDKYTAVWVSHSSMGDFLKCPRLYYLHNMYKKDPKTGHKVSIVSPRISLGVAVHNVLECLGEFPSNERMNRDLLKQYEEEWAKVTGKKGGFTSDEEEKEFKERGRVMLENVKDELERFKKLAVAVYEKISTLDFPDTSKYAKTLDGIKEFEEDLINGSK